MSKIKLTVAQKYYIEQHYGQKDDKSLAADTGLGVRTVRSILKKLEEEGFEPQKPKRKKSGAERAGFGVKEGVVVMTESASMDADKPHPKRNARVRGGLHVIDPSQPSY